MATCRDEILRAARAVMRQAGRETFTAAEVVTHLKAAGSPYSENTIRTHVNSRMCLDAPANHDVVYRDIQRVARGQYRLVSD